MITGGIARSRDGTRINYLSLGAGPTLICVHGGMATGADWIPTATLLADRYRVIVYDRRGTGSSDSGATGHSVALEVDDLCAVLDATGGAHAVLAHSFGALIALNAATRPELPVGTLVLYEPPVMVDPEKAERHLARARRLMAAGQYEGLLLEALTNMLDVPAAAVDAMRSDQRAWTALVASAPTLLAQAEMTVEVAGAYEHFRAITQPTLLLLGERGGSRQLFADSATVLREAVPQLATTTLAGQGHAAMVHAPGLVAAEIAGHLADLSVHALQDRREEASGCPLPVRGR